MENHKETFENDESSSLGIEPSMSECRVDNSTNIISMESSENVVSEPQLMPAKETEQTSAITISDKNVPLKGSKSKPGVILLGRGNSFSLGRSEVILLHSRPVRRSKDKAKQGPSENPLDSIEELGNTPPSPPPISEGVSSKMTKTALSGWQGTQRIGKQKVENVVSDESDITDAEVFAKHLHQLWSKAEKVMTASQSRVLKVLEEFGIGEQAGGGGDDGGEGKHEEEQVWQIVQENYRSLR